MSVPLTVGGGGDSERRALEVGVLGWHRGRHLASGFRNGRFVSVQWACGLASGFGMGVLCWYRGRVGLLRALDTGVLCVDSGRVGLLQA